MTVKFRPAILFAIRIREAAIFPSVGAETVEWRIGLRSVDLHLGEQDPSARPFQRVLEQDLFRVS